MLVSNVYKKNISEKKMQLFTRQLNELLLNHILQNCSARKVNYLEDPAKARGFSTNTSVIH